MTAVVSPEESIIEATIDLSKAFRALGNDGQLRVITVLSSGPMVVNDIVKALGAAQPTVSKWLAVLKEAELVECVAIGVSRWYSLNVKAFEDLHALTGAFSLDLPNRVVIDEDNELMIIEDEFAYVDGEGNFIAPEGLEMIPFKNWDAEIEAAVAEVRTSDSEPVEVVPEKLGFWKRLFSF